MDTRPLAEVAAELAGMVRLRNERATELKQLDEQIDEGRADLHALMQLHGTKSVQHPLVKVTRQQGSRLAITSQLEVEAALREAGLYDSCLKDPSLDLRKVKSLAEHREMPGVERQPYDQLSVELVNQLT